MYRPIPAAAALGAALALSLAAPAQAGTAEVTIPDVQHLTDAGRSPIERDQNLGELTRFVQQLAVQRLPGDQTLKVEFKDIDLAGEEWPDRHGRELRIARGGADWPRLTLHYVLQGPQGVIREGDATLEDMNYANAIADRYTSESLSYEKRLLASWFQHQVLQRGS